MHFKEIEFKYDADTISMKVFEDLMENNFQHRKKMLVSSYDDYFTDPAGNFIRYRYTDGRGELTIKRKTSDKNNNERIEVNVPTAGDNLKTVTAFVDLLGYKHNFGIYKTCKIYWIDKVVLVYYVVYDKEMKELRRFIEIEADEELSWESEQQAWDEIAKWEKVIEPLGITPKNRLRKSLFEIFRKAVSPST
jgi:adenylate cyclase class IV